MWCASYARCRIAPVWSTRLNWISRISFQAYPAGGAPCLLGYLDNVPKKNDWDRVNWTLELLALRMQTDTGVELSCGYMLRLQRRWGCRRGRPRPGLRISARGRRKVLENSEKLIASASLEQEVFYRDEGDLHLTPKIGPTYLKRGQ